MKKVVPQLVTVGTGTRALGLQIQSFQHKPPELSESACLSLGVIEAQPSSSDSSFSCRRTSEGHAVHLLCARRHGKQQCHHVRQRHAAEFKGERQISAKLQGVQGKAACIRAYPFRHLCILWAERAADQAGRFQTQRAQRSNTKGSRVHLVQ